MLINWARLRRRRSETCGKNINNFRFKDDTILLTERNNDLKLLLMKVKEESYQSKTAAEHQEDKNHDHRSNTHL